MKQALLGQSWAAMMATWAMVVVVQSLAALGEMDLQREKGVGSAAKGPCQKGDACQKTAAQGLSVLQHEVHPGKTVRMETAGSNDVEPQLFEAFALENKTPLLDVIKDVSLDNNVTQEEEEQAFATLPDDWSTKEQEEELNKGGKAICGNEILEDGEECDVDNPCCTKQCKFAPKTAICHKATDPCDVGGHCAGDSLACIDEVVKKGVSCPKDGKCFQGSCASRLQQCQEAGFDEPCGEGCEALTCKNSGGKCTTLTDMEVLPGTPCGTDRQCSLEEKCVATTELPSFAETSDSLIQREEDNTVSVLDNQERGFGLPGVKVCWVVTRAAYRLGYQWGKILELSKFMDLVYRERSGIPIQIVTPQLYVDNAGELDDYHQGSIGSFANWARRKRSEGKIHADVAHVQLLGGITCGGSSGVAYIGRACDQTYSVGMSWVADKHRLCETPRAYAWRWGTIAHELGHNLGMKHLWDNTGGRSGATNHIMDYGNYGLWTFHQESKDDFTNHKSGFTCMKPIHQSGIVVFLRNAHNGRYLFADGSNIRASRGIEGGWTHAPKVRAVDANYYNLAKFILRPVGSYYQIESEITGRLVLGQGSNVKGKYAQEGGWTHAPPVTAAEANYYNLSLWQKIESGGKTYFINYLTGRLLMAQGSNVFGKYAHEGGWGNAPYVVNADANYYGLAGWHVQNAR